ncbi:MAG: class I SAM-dependent methyltransferase [Patescibacteria group bacterium]
MLRDRRSQLCRGLDFQKAGIQAISRAIGATAPGNVLELGSGNGFNLLALSAMHPEIKEWQGVEFTKSGIAASEKLKREPPFDALIYMTELPREEITRRLNGARIEYR